MMNNDDMVKYLLVQQVSVGHSSEMLSRSSYAFRKSYSDQHLFGHSCDSAI